MQTETGNNTDKVKKKPADIAGRIKDKPAYERTEEDVNQNYGFEQGADVDTHAEVTQRQEYAADGLPRTDRYSVDKVGRKNTYSDDPDADRGAHRDSAV